MNDTITTEPGSRRQADVGRFALLLVILVATIALLGLIGLPKLSQDPSRIARMAFMVLAAAILFATIRITRTSEHEQRIAGVVIGVIGVIGVAAFILSDSVIVGQILGVVWVLLVISTPVLVLREVLSADDVSVQTIIGAICVYLLFGISLTFIAVAIDGWGGFFAAPPRPTGYVYFAFVTITSLGYGDLTPYSDGARLVSITFAVIAQMYLVIVVARLVSVWKPRRGSLDSKDTA